MINYRIVPAQPWHAGGVARRLGDQLQQPNSRLAVIAARDRLRGYIRDSFYSRAALLEGVPVALWGLKAGLLNGEALVWLVVTSAAKRHFVSAGRVARAEIAEMLKQGKHLRSFVPADDRSGLRFLDFLGFEHVESADEDGWVRVVRRAC